MKIGISTYSLFWEWHEPNHHPMTIEDMVRRAASLECEVFQICDDPRIGDYVEDQLTALRKLADGLRVHLELGTRSIDDAHLNHYLDMAELLGAETLRSMIQRPEIEAGPEPVIAQLRQLVPRLERTKIRLALETYEQVSTRMLVAVVQAVDSPLVGVCLDPANCVSALEHPNAVIEMAAPYTTNLHVKDFAFSRAEGWVGFRYAGARIGEGLLELERELDAVYRDDRDPSAIVEHWVPWQGDLETSVATERDWTTATLAALRTWRDSHTNRFVHRSATQGENCE